MLTDMMPWMSDVGRYAIMVVCGIAALVALWFAVKFYVFLRTAV